MCPDRCANRDHALSAPPPVRAGRLAPNGGCMPCVKDRRTPCPYRRRFGCADAHRDLGVSLGRCVFEVAQREQFIDDANRDLEWVPEEDRRRYAMAMARWIDAVIYARRAQAWQTIAFDREPSVRSNGHDASSPDRQGTRGGARWCLRPGNRTATSALGVADDGMRPRRGRSRREATASAGPRHASGRPRRRGVDRGPGPARVAGRRYDDSAVSELRALEARNLIDDRRPARGDPAPGTVPSCESGGARHSWNPEHRPRGTLRQLAVSAPATRPGRTG